MDMKKIILVLALLSVIMVTYSQKRLSLSFLASPQVSWLRSDSKSIGEGKNFTGFGYGVEGDFYLGSENYALTTGMTVSTAGGTLIYNQSVPFSGKVLPAGTKVDYYISYLEFPFALKMSTRDFNRLKYFAQFGFTNWFTLKAKATTSNGSFQKETISDEVRNYNVGLNVGTGLSYDLGQGNALTCGIIYSNGLRDATRNSDVNDTATLRVLRFRFGFVF
jgi:hypothetical protein